MANYRKKPVAIEAFKLGVDYIPDWFMDAVTSNEVILRGTSSGFDHVDDTNADIHTLEGWHHANYGDYIIRGVKGEIYPCKPDIFDMTYDAVENIVDPPVGDKMTPAADKLSATATNADRIRAMNDDNGEHLLLDYQVASSKRKSNIYCNSISCVNSKDGRCTAEDIHLVAGSARLYHGKIEHVWGCADYHSSVTPEEVEAKVKAWFGKAADILYGCTEGEGNAEEENEPAP